MIPNGSDEPHQTGPHIVEGTVPSNPENHDFARPAFRYAIVTPVRDEQEFVGEMIESILSQQSRPTHWVIVDDGSSDRTPEILEGYARDYSFIQVVRLAPRNCRLPGGEWAVSAALANIPFKGIDLLARFDADVVFQAGYMDRMFSEFAANPRLGIAGGGLYVRRNNGLVLERRKETHVRGSVKMYRRQCFEQIGGLTADIGWDTLDELIASVKGWETRTFEDVAAVHRRATGQAISRSYLYGARGRAEYLTWSSLVFVMGKALALAFGQWSLSTPIFYLAGYFTAWRRREPRVADPEIPRIRRAQQRDRVLDFLRTRLGRSRPVTQPL